jgi:hypothetical protein
VMDAVAHFWWVRPCNCALGVPAGMIYSLES